MSENENSSVESDPSDEGRDDDLQATADAEATGIETEVPENEALKMELEQAVSEVTAAREDVLRARAEAENVRKRAERDVAAAHKFGLERFIGELLPVKDSMDLGFDALDSATDSDAIREGMALTRKMFDVSLVLSHKQIFL